MTLFDFVKNNLSIIEIISEYVQLKPAGSYYKAPCPFHSETEGSFTVSPDKQIFYCFGCQAGGDLISFIAKIENLSQIEAVKFLIDKYNLQIPDEIQKNNFNDLQKNSGQKDLCFKVNQAIADFSHETLLKSDIARSYLENRKIDLKIIKHFSIGYFPGGVRFINSFMKKLASQGIMLKDLLENGFLFQGRNVIYSSFEERILFPIKDVMGRYVGFGGRIFKPGDDRAKYYNSKDSDWFSKGKILFGLDSAKKDMQKKGCAYLVEGYTDCVAMVQHGYKNTVATLGTACTIDHLKTLSRYIDELFVLYDGDDAGQKAIVRLTQLCWDVDLDLKVVKLPKSDDPASLLTKNENFDFTQNSMDIFSFFIESVGSDFSNKTLSEKLKMSEKIVEVISNINNSFKQDLLLQQASRVTQVPFDSLKSLMKSFSFGYKKNFSAGKEETVLEKQSCEQRDQLDGFEAVSLLEEKIFSAIMNSIGKNERFWVEEDLISFFSVKIQILLQKLDTLIKNFGANSNFSLFLDSLDEASKKWVLKVCLKFEEEVSLDYFQQLNLQFRKVNWKQILQGIKFEILKAKQNDNKKELQILLKKYSEIKKEIQVRGLI
ncbi:MAG: DNA primase [bacterium]